MAIAHAVVAREIGRSLRGSDHVIGRYRERGARQGDIDQGRAQGLVLGQRGANEHGHRGVETIAEVLPGKADTQPREGLPQLRDVVVHGPLGAGGVARIVARHRRQHKRAVFGAVRHRAALIETGGVGDHAQAGYAAVGRFEARDTAKGRRLTNRAARVRARRRSYEARGNRGGGPARRAARHALSIPGIAAHTVKTALVGGAHRELVHIGLAERHGAGGMQALDHGGVVGRGEIVEHARGATRAHTPRAKNVFVCDGNPRERPGPARRAALVGGPRLSPGARRIDGNEAVEIAIGRFDTRQRLFRERDTGGRAGLQGRAQGGESLFEPRISHALCSSRCSPKQADKSRSLEHPRHEVKPLVDGGGQRLQPLALIVFRDPIPAQGLAGVQRVGHRLQTLYRRRLQLFEEFEGGVEALREGHKLRVARPQTGESGHRADRVAADGHGRGGRQSSVGGAPYPICSLPNTPAVGTLAPHCRAE